MKIHQEKQPFAPITIVLESEMEVNALWIAVAASSALEISSNEREFLRQLSDWFSHKEKL